MFQVTTVLPQPNAPIGSIPLITAVQQKPPKVEGETEEKKTDEQKVFQPMHEKLVNYKKDLFGKP